MAEPLTPTSNGGYPGAHDPHGRSGAMDDRSWAYRRLLARRWPLLAAFGVLGGLVVAWSQRNDLPQYQVQALLQRQEEAAPVVSFQVNPRAQDQLFASDLEILRTSAVLGPVVDSLGLRMRLLEPRQPVSRVFEEVRILPEAPAGTYEISVEDGTARLRSEDGQLLATAGESGLLSGEGFYVVMAQGAGDLGRVRFAVDGRTRAADALGRQVQIDRMVGTNLIRISYRAADPQRAAEVANAVAMAFQDYAAQRARLEATRRKEFLAERLSSIADSLATAQSELLSFQAASQTVNPQQEGQALSQALVTEQSRLRDLENNERTLESLLASFSVSGRSEEALRQMVVLSADFFPAAGALYTRLQELEGRRSNLTASPLVGRTAADPQVQALDSLIAETKNEMREIAAQSLQVLRQRREVATERVRELRGEVGAVPLRSTTFGRLEQRVQAIQSMHEMLAEKYYEAQIAEAVEAGDVEVLEAARPPLVPLPAHRARNLFLGVVGGVFLGLLLATIQERADTRIRGDRDAIEASGLQLLASIPVLELGDGTSGKRALAQKGRDLEAFRMLRTNLRFARAEQMRVIVVTSPTPEDGKSIVTANLAASFARDGTRVLLIDADMRRPVQHEIFGVERGPGLSDLLVGAASQSVVRAIEDQGMHILTAGTSVPNPPELLGSPAFARLMERASERFEIVLVDAPPVLAVTDASVLGQAADGVVMVSRFEQTDRHALARSVDQLRQTQVPVVGLVLNGLPTSRRLAKYGGYSGYYADYGYGDGDAAEKGRKPRRSARAGTRT